MEKTREEFLSDNSVKNIITVIIYCTIPVVLLIAIMLIMKVVYNKMDINSLWAEMISVQSIPSFLALGFIPGLIYRMTTKKSIKAIAYPRPYSKASRIISILILVSFIAVLFVFQEYTLKIMPFIFHFLIIAIVEEFLIRGIITDRLKEIFLQEWIVIILSALIFSFVFHSESGFFISLLSHTPFALLMSVIYKKTGSLEAPILIHWSYNVILTIIEVM